MSEREEELQRLADEMRDEVFPELPVAAGFAMLLLGVGVVEMVVAQSYTVLVALMLYLAVVFNALLFYVVWRLIGRREPK